MKHTEHRPQTLSELAAAIGIPLDDVKQWPQESHRTTIDGRQYELDDPALECLKGKRGSGAPSDPNTRDTDRCSTA